MAHEAGLADDYAALWESNDSAPDVFAYLEQHSEASVPEKLAVLIRDQQCRWQTDQPLKVEDYLVRLPELTTDQQVKLELAVGEFRARQDSGTTPGIDEFTSRFPDIADSLRRNLSELASGSNKDAQQREVTTTETFISDATIGDRQIGRYRLSRKLGEGAFGVVWLAFDEELQRQVAIKVPTRERFQKPEDAEAYLAEARTVASLDHANIVPVHDVGRTDDGSIYVVSKFIEGRTLSDRIKQDRPGHEEATRLLATVAQALHHAHQKRLIHRDVKPGNILIEESTGTPYVADFGLAISEEDYLRDSKVAGTPAYMSPEQARGEGHRLDGRSDIFSLGVVFYQLLTGKRPFRGGTHNELFHQIVSVAPTPPREIDDSIPAELARICLKCLSKRASDRYSTAAELADDLLHWKSGLEEPIRKEVKIVPKGLRSFDADDAEFFLELLPGPHDRDGLPESIRFWKTRIEETDADKTFNVGLIYGPSGCGKSSLVKAGLLPRLSDQVITIYVEATPEETETRILRGLRKQVPELPDDLGLVDTFAALRRGTGKKAVVVLDQFEQWLHAHRAEQETELVSALRQCDGGNIQCIVMVRDDFAMAAARFMASLDIPIVQGHNFATVDLFDIDHAQNILARFGQAFGKLPAQLSGLSETENEFLTSVASGLSQDGKVVSVRLALFVEMVKGKPWTFTTLEEIGGTEGIGISFLEETFSSREANPEHRLHQQAAREVLKALLPEVGTDIKGHMRSHAELLEASGYQSRPSDFNDLLRILDGELRLITPTDPEGFQTDSGSDPSSKYYQLTHDYLVPSLTEWLTRKQKETRKGRAEIRLAERSALWNAKRENRHLPSLLEWARIRTLTDKKKWTKPQRKMMGKAGWIHGVRFTMLAIIVAALTFTGLHIRGRVVDASNEERAAGLVTALLKAEIQQVPEIIRSLEDYRQWAEPKLEEEYDKHNESSKERLHASLALLPGDPKQVEYLKGRLLTAAPSEVDVIRCALAGHKGSIVDELWQVVEKPSTEEEKQLLQAASALALYDPASERWEAVAGRTANTLVSENTLRAAVWINTLQPIRGDLGGSLGKVFRNRDGNYTQTQRDLATDILEKYAADDVDTLVELTLDAEPKQFVALFDELANHEKDAIEKLTKELDRKPTFKWNDAPLDPTWTNPDTSLVQRIEAAHGMIAERFAFCQTMPLEQFVEVAESLRKSGYRPIRFRPFAHANAVHVAAVWTRDGRDWQLVHGLTAEQIAKQDEQLRAEGSAAVDVAGYISQLDQTLAEQYGAVWAKCASDEEETRIYVGASKAEHKSTYEAIEKAGFPFRHSLQSFRGVDGQQKRCGVRSKREDYSTFSSDQTSSEYDQKERLSEILSDIDVSNAAKVEVSEDRYERVLAAAEEKLIAKPDDLSARNARGQAHFHLSNDEEALEDLNFVTEKAPTFPSGYQFRAVLHARMGKAEEAKQDLAKFVELSKSASSNAYLDAVVAAYLGEDTEGMKRLEAFVQENANDSASLYDAACAYSIVSGVFTESDAAKSKAYADRAVALLKQAVSNGYSNYSHMQTDSDLDPIRQQVGFQGMMAHGQLDRRYAAVWQTSREYESQETHGLSSEENLERCRDLLSQGYRPVAISVASIDDENELVTASAWHRPLVPEEEKELLAKRQANAAVALMRMGRADRVWPLLKHSPDPRLRTWIVHRVSPLEASPEAMADRLDEEADVSIRRALILCVGEYESTSSLDRDSWTKRLLKLYQNDPDAGIHGSAEWVLRRWGEEADIAKIDTELATGKIEAERNWYLTKQGHTMVVFHEPGEFLMGSRGTEKDRSSRETLHRRHMGRSFALASTEVTVKQFQDFLREAADVRHTYTKKYAPEENCPQTAVTWYEAAAYCRWLSDRAHVPEHQMCYPPVPEIKEGMKLEPDYLSRTGYRLPTEAEWEFACRAGTRTSRYYGQSEQLLGQYAWYAATGRDRTWPVGSLKPNDFGLFDMHGNVYEWCQEKYGSYSVGIKSKAAEDVEDTTTVSSQVRRVLRGGSFNHDARSVRSANRSNLQPANRSYISGFRPARTYP